MPFSPASRLARLALLVSLGASLASAHVELLFPPPINSKYDPQTLEANIDYSMTSPLADDGSNFPCKGYNTPEAYSSLKPVATLQAGTDFDIEFAPGGATHGGGSCQFSISYDQGKTFAVLYSVEGGCPLTSNYKVPIPADLPSATSATFAWTWFNKVGNREMYMNCAIVDIAGSQATSYTGPELYKANVFEDGTCRTVEGVEPVFPNPGPAVEYGGSTTKSSPVTSLDNCDLKQDGDVTVSPSSSSATPSKPSKPSSTSSSSSSAAPSSSSANFNPLPSTSVPAQSTSEAQSKRPTFKDRTAAASPSSSSVTTSSASPSTSAAPSSSPPLVWHKVSTVSQSPSSSQSPPPSNSSPTPVSSASPTSLQAAVTRPPYVRKTTRAPIRTPVRVTTTYTRTAFTTSTATATTTTTATTTVTSSACSTADVAEPTSTSDDGAGGDGAGSGGGGGSYLRCDTLVTFSLCDSNGCTPMGSVAPGTQCRDGQIVLATAQRLIKVRRGAVVGVPLRGGPVSINVNQAVPTMKTTTKPNVVARRNLNHQPRRHS